MHFVGGFVHFERGAGGIAGEWIPGFDLGGLVVAVVHADGWWGLLFGSGSSRLFGRRRRGCFCSSFIVASGHCLHVIFIFITTGFIHIFVFIIFFFFFVNVLVGIFTLQVISSFFDILFGYGSESRCLAIGSIIIGTSAWCGEWSERWSGAVAIVGVADNVVIVLAGGAFARTFGFLAHGLIELFVWLIMMLGVCN